MRMVARTKRLGRKTRALLIILLLISLVAVWGMNNLTPIMVAMAEARARQLAVEAVNDGVSEVMDQSVGYSDLVKVTTDQNGQISMLQSNTLLMNELASKAALATQRKLQALETGGIGVPLGSALGIALFSGTGPAVPVSVVLVGSVTTRFVTAFESAGINQTRHEISMEASMLIRVIVPTGANSVTVSAYVPVAESIIVGQVPDTYVNVPDVDSSLNLIP